MKRVKNISVVLLFCCLAGGSLMSCVNYHYLAEERRRLPKTPNFRLKGELLPGASAGLVDPHSLYVKEGLSERTGDIYYHYYRFWEDGHVLHRSLAMTTPPTLADGESFYGCDVGYYTIDGHALLIELFVPDPDEGAVYETVEAELTDDNIMETRSWVRGFFTEKAGIREYYPPKVYHKIYVGPMAGEPDW